MNANINNQGNQNQKKILTILNKNVIMDKRQKEVVQTMGISSCQVACMSYKCCTGHGTGGKHTQHIYKMEQ